MKPATAWAELKRILGAEGHDELVKTMESIESAPEPDYVYRVTTTPRYAWERPSARVGSRHRANCILSNNVYRRGDVKIERAPATWTDVTNDFKVNYIDQIRR